MSLAHTTTPAPAVPTLVALAILGVGQPACAQPLPCRFDVAAVLQAADCGLGGTLTVGTAINPSGTTVVGYRECLGTLRPWKWSQTGGLVMLTLPPWLLDAIPQDVNDNNIMIGTGEHSVVGVGSRGFLCDLSSMTWSELLPQNPPTGWSGANAISRDSTVVGFRSIDDGGDPVNPFTATIWSANTGVEDLGVMNGPNSSATGIADDGTVVGWTGAGEFTAGTRGFFRKASQVTLLPPINGGSSSSLYSINSSGTLSCGRGRKQLPNGQTSSETFAWNGQTMTMLGALPGTTIGFVFDVADDGSIVGMCRSLQPAQDRAYVWRDGTIRDLYTLVQPDSGLFSVPIAQAISDTGMIAADANLNAGGHVAVRLSPVYGNAGDVDLNCQTDADDLILVILEWGERNSPADANGDGIVDVDDLIIVIVHWSP